MQTYPDRIPYEVWINSQLSIARHYGGITLGQSRYIIDYSDNSLVRADVLKAEKRATLTVKKMVEKMQKAKAKENQIDLF